MFPFRKLSTYQNAIFIEILATYLINVFIVPKIFPYYDNLNKIDFTFLLGLVIAFQISYAA
jgi:hypothetical protein